MFVHALPPTTNFGVWEVTMEFTDTEDIEPIDFSIYPNIRLEVLDPFSGAIAMALTKTRGQITTPAPGIIEWRATAGHMSGLHDGKYKVRLMVRPNGANEERVLMDSSISIVGD